MPRAQTVRAVLSDAPAVLCSDELNKMGEEMSDEDLTAYCGLYCGDCIRYRSKACDLATALLKELQKRQFLDYSRVKRFQVPEFEKYESMITALTALSQLQCETPCRRGGDGCGGSCPIIRCVKDKSLKGCWECADFETCKKSEFLKLLHADSHLKNLRAIQKHGLQSWTKYREKCYPWVT